MKIKMTEERAGNLRAQVKFAERLKELRTERKISQVELAQSINVSKGIISLWENGLREPTLNSLLALAEFFSLSLDELVGLKEY